MSMVVETSMAEAVAVAVVVEVCSIPLHMTGRNTQDIQEDKL